MNDKSKEQLAREAKAALAVIEPFIKQHEAGIIKELKKNTDTNEMFSLTGALRGMDLVIKTLKGRIQDAEIEKQIADQNNPET